MSSICPPSEVDELTVCLLTIFEQRGLIFDLFEALIQYEVEQTGMGFRSLPLWLSPSS